MHAREGTASLAGPRRGAGAARVAPCSRASRWASPPARRIRWTRSCATSASVPCRASRLRSCCSISEASKSLSGRIGVGSCCSTSGRRGARTAPRRCPRRSRGSIAEFRDQGLVDPGDQPRRVQGSRRSVGAAARPHLPGAPRRDAAPVSGAYRVRATPTVVLVDRRGQLVGRTVGSREWDTEGRALLTALLAVRPCETTRAAGRGSVTRLAGQVAVVTGASRGIGRAIALTLAREGARVVVNYARSRERGEAVVAEIRRAAARPWPSAPTSRAPTRSIGCSHRRSSSSDACHAWVNNAGADILTGEARTWPAERQWDEVMAVDLKGAWLCSRAAAEVDAPRRRRGHRESLVGPRERTAWATRRPPSTPPRRAAWRR